VATATLVFCRFALSVLFVASVIGKAARFGAFQRTLVSFEIPTSAAKPFAGLLLLAEMAVVIGLCVGSPLLLWAFLLAGLLLIAFSVAISRTLARGTKAPCNCFGSGHRPVTYAEIWRNAGFLVCACIGLLEAQRVPLPPRPLDWPVPALAALGFGLVWMHMGDVVQIMRGRSGGT
jgi:hypothetical protein